MEKITTYDSVYYETSDGLVTQDYRERLSIPVKFIEDDGTIKSAAVGDQIEQDAALVFIVDKGLGEQFHKLCVKSNGLLPELYLKDGEVLDELLTDQERKVIELEQQLMSARAVINNGGFE